MKKHLKSMYRRFLSIILVLIMIMSVCSLGLTSVLAADTSKASDIVAQLGSDAELSATAEDSSAISGDETLLDKVVLIENDEYYVRTNKTSYACGEPVYVVANGYYESGTVHNPWVGIFDASVEDGEYARANLIYGYNLKDYKNIPFDIKGGTYYSNAGVPKDLPAGNYKAVVFQTQSYKYYKSSATFEITHSFSNGSEVSDSLYIYTDKSTYLTGEDIYVKASSDITTATKAWVAIYPKDATVNKSNYLHWYYFQPKEGEDYNKNGQTINIIQSSGKSPASEVLAGVALDPGEYTIYVLGDGSDSYSIRAQVDITVSDAFLTINKSNATYSMYEDIIVSPKYATYLTNSWVGLYTSGTTPAGVTNAKGCYAWSYIDDGSFSINLQDVLSEDGNSFNGDAGSYTLYFFGDNGYSNIIDSVDITVNDKIYGKFGNAMYQIDNVSDGYANGRVVLQLDPARYGYAGKIDAALYWANSNGNYLTEFASLSRVPVTSDIVVLDMHEYTYIPENAASLNAYMSSPNYGEVYSTKYNFALPDGTATVTGLDDTVLSEFQMVSDIHIYSADIPDYYTSDEVSSNKTLQNSQAVKYSQSHYLSMLRDIADISPDSSGIFINGDIANNGFEEEYEMADALYNQVKDEVGDLPQQYINLGNHDTYAYPNADVYVAYANSLGAGITSDAPYYSKDVNGYRYIFLAGDNPIYYGRNQYVNPDRVNCIDAEISDEQIAWLDEQLAESEDLYPGKPVFVMLHQGLPESSAGNRSDDIDYPGVVNYDEVINVLKKYDNVFYFSGHNHMFLDAPNTIYGGDGDLPISINTSSVNYSWTDYNLKDGDGYSLNGGEGFYVKVYADKIVFMGRDFVNNLWLPSACFVIYTEPVLEADDLNLITGETRTPTYYLNYSGDRELVFETSDSTVATVDGGGLVTARSAGKATITVTALSTDTEVISREKFTVSVSNTVAGDEMILDKNWSGSYVYSSKEAFDLGEPIYITADGGYWVGIYEGDVADYANTECSYWYYIDGGSDTDTRFDGVPVDIRTLSPNTKDTTIDPTFTTGKYQAVLFETEDQSQVIDAVEFQVSNALFFQDPQYDETISSDKDRYFYGEPIYITADSSNAGGYYAPWVGVFPKGADYSTATNAASNLLRYYYLSEPATGTVDAPAPSYNYNAQAVNLYDYDVNAKGVELTDTLPAGEYDIVLFQTNNYNRPRGCISITVEGGNATVFASKDTYGQYEDIAVTVNYPSYYQDGYTSTNTCKYWVGVYDESILNGEVPSASNSDALISWYYINRTPWTVVLNDLQEVSKASEPLTIEDMKVGEYSVYLFTDSTYNNYISKDTYTIVPGMSGLIGKGAYKIDNMYDGFANGTVAFEIDPDSYGYIGGSYVPYEETDSEGTTTTKYETRIKMPDVNFYWADESGTPLEGYTALHQQPLNSPYITFAMYPYTIIPEDARSLVACIASYGSEGSGYVISLPDSCKGYTGLDKGVLSEFQMVSDTHIYSANVSTYPNGDSKLDNGQSKKYSHSNFQAMLEDIAQVSPSSSGVFINGDITNNGLEEEFDEVMPLYNKVATDLGVQLPQLYVNMGNHDSYATVDLAPYVTFANSLGAGITSDAPYYSKTVNGYKYIFLAGDNYQYYGYNSSINPDRINSGDAELSDTQLQWLDAQLADNEKNNSGKPVFVMLHQALYNSVAGAQDTAEQGWDGVVNYDELEAVLTKYNNVIYLSGHSHAILNSPDNIIGGSYSEFPVSVNTSSVNYIWNYYENWTDGYITSSAEGFYVKVYEDKTVFLGRDFVNGLWIPDACYVIYNSDVQVEDDMEIMLNQKITVSDYVTNPNARNLTVKSSDDSVATVSQDGTITATGVGTATIYVTADPTDTEVITREKLTLTVVHSSGKESAYFVKGSFDDWGDGLNLSYTNDIDVVTATVELAAGEYDFKINDNVEEIWYSSTTTIENVTDEGVVMSTDVDDSCTLYASGGTYTFNYTISTNTLTVSYISASTVETGNQSATIYVDYTSSSFTETPYIYIWEPGSTEINNNIGPLWPGMKLEGPNENGYYYRTFRFNESYQFIIGDGDNLQTVESAVHTETELYVVFKNDTDYTACKSYSFCVDLYPDDDTSGIDLLYPELIDGIYYIFLPSGIDASSLEFHVAEGTKLQISSVSVENGGVINLSGGVNKDVVYTLGGDYVGKLMIKQSSSVASVYTSTGESVPVTVGYGDSKDDYSTSGSVMMMDSEANITLSTSYLKRLKGRGNSSWKASNELIGKYAFNLTLDKKESLIPDTDPSKKYCLVSYNADEARMRNMTVLELAQAIGVEYTSNCMPVDLYNNGYYIGSYLLTEKVEIGNPVVDITDLDKINENCSDNNAAIYDEVTELVRAYGGPSNVSGIDENKVCGFFKYVDNLDEPDASIYASSGFLLEFELDERFAFETSGFISQKGQQIVCKYPEYATCNQMLFIMDKWDKAETVIYNESATYEELNAVIDIESFAKMYLIQELTKNLDAASTSYYVYYHNGKFHAGVAWDYDWTLGQYVQSGDSNISVDNQTSGKFADDAKKLLNDPEGWWANSKEIYPSTGILNAQAALCQNDVFWNVVKAEWNTEFYNTAMTFTTGNVTSAADIGGKFAAYRTLMRDTTAMDEFKWGIIAGDPLADWGSADTGSTYDAAVVSLNNFYYTRLQWMNEQLTSTETVLATPGLITDKSEYILEETVTLTATCNSSGILTYKFYNSYGTLLSTVITDDGSATYCFTATEIIDEFYSVEVTSESAASPVTAQANVVVNSFDFELAVSVPETVSAGSSFTIKSVTNIDDTVLYCLYNSNGQIIDSNYSGEFYILTTDADVNTTLEYTVKAETKYNDRTFTTSKAVAVDVITFEFDVTLSAKDEVEAGSSIELTATAISPGSITYNFFNAEDGSFIESNTAGVLSVATTGEDVNTVKSFYVVAETSAYGTSYTATSDVIDINIIEVIAVYNITLYFKSTSTIGYRPMITTNGAVVDVADKYMERDIFIWKNQSETASYFWYKHDLQVPQNNPTVYFRILSSRYAMEVHGSLTATEDKTYYFAVDNLNDGTVLVDLTDVPESERNWCSNALHMVYDSRYDTLDSLAEISAKIDLRYLGDTNADGRVNIRDATYIQKFLAGLISMNETGLEVADVDGDEKVTIKDATALQKKLAGMHYNSYADIGGSFNETH